MILPLASPNLASLPSIQTDEAITADNTLGALFIGCLLSIFLFGILTHQVLLYIDKPEARPGVKGLVALIWLLDLAQSVFQIHGMYNTIVTNYGDIISALNPVWTISMSLLWACFIYTSIQGFLIYRIGVLSRSRLIIVLCSAVTMIQFAVILAAVCLALSTSLPYLMGTHPHLLDMGMATGMIVDTLLAGTLSYYLFRRSRASMKSTRSVARGLMVFSIEMGIVTSLIRLSATVTCWTMPHNAIWIAILFFHSKFYAIALLISLNRVVPQEKQAARPRADPPSAARRPIAIPWSEAIPPNHQGVVVVEMTATNGIASQPESETGTALNSSPPASMKVSMQDVGETEEITGMEVPSSMDPEVQANAYCLPDHPHPRSALHI